MKSVVLSIKPYWVFLIIAKTMGWKIDKEKTIEVRKSRPRDGNWNRAVILYCTKDKRSLKQIPKEYQPLMEKFLGKVIGEFVCDKIYPIWVFESGTIKYWNYFNLSDSCLSLDETAEYIGRNKTGYGWHISDLLIYDKPKELLEFIKPCENDLYCEECAMFRNFEDKCGNSALQIKRPPQSWCYV